MDTSLPQTDGPSKRIDVGKDNAAVFESQFELCLGGAMDVVPGAFIVAYGAARNAGFFRKVTLRPIQKAARRTTMCGRQNSWLTALIHD